MPATPEIRGPFADEAQCLDFKRATEFEDSALRVECLAGPDGRIFARVARDAPDGSGQAFGVAGGAAAGALAGAAVGGPIGAAAGALVGLAAGALATTADKGASVSGLGRAMREGATRFGVDPHLLAAIAFVESSFRPDVRNPHSSAFGLFQFIDGTWADTVRRHGAPVGVSVTDRAAIGAQCLMGAALLGDNTAALRGILQRKPSAGECYAAHFLGLGDAGRMLRAGAETPSDVALGDRAAGVIDANRPIFLSNGQPRTVSEVFALFDAKMAKADREARRLLGETAPAEASPGDAARPFANPGAAVPAGSNPIAAAGEPAWLTIARGEIGQKERGGDADNQRIVEYFTATTLGEQPDAVPWCGAFVSFCLREAGLIAKGSARAADWLAFGEASIGRPGCVVVLQPQSPQASGHVGFWVAQAAGRIHVLGGNQRDAVNVTTYPESELRAGGLRWPTGVP